MYVVDVGGVISCSSVYQDLLVGRSWWWGALLITLCMPGIGVGAGSGVGAGVVEVVVGEWWVVGCGG